MRIHTPERQGRGSTDEIAAVAAWAETWYRDEHDRDRLSFDGIPCGDAIRVDVFEFVLEAVNRALGLPSRRMGRPMFRPLRARGIDRDVRAWGLRIARLGRRPPGGARPVAFITEGATPSMLGSSMAVARELAGARAAVGASDPRAYRAWRRDGWDPFALVLEPAEDRRVANRATAPSTELWNEARRRCRSLIIGGRDLTPIALQAMDRFVPRSLARLSVDRRAIARYLDATDASVVVLASDQHRTGRLAVAIARQEGRRSVVLQHGLPQARTGYLPVHADVVLAWSDGAASWFVERGTAPERVSVVGNPRLDELARVVSRASDGIRATPTEHGTERRVLLALSIAPVAVNSRIVAITLDAVLSLPDAVLIIKLHPGGSDWGFVRRRVREREGSGGRITVLEREPLYPLLAWADVVVVHQSTVAAEALAGRRPVIAVAADGTSVASEELSFLRLPEVVDALELASLIVELPGGAGAAEFIAEREAAIVEAVGPVDGLSARRAADAILAMASEGRQVRQE